MSTRIFNQYGFLLGLLAMLTLFSCQENEVPEIIADQETPELQDENIIPNRYIVQFEENFVTPSKERNQTFSDRTSKKTFSEARQKDATRTITNFLSEAAIDHSNVDRIYTAAISGFAGELTAEQVEKLKADPKVKLVEPDRLVSIDLPETERNTDVPLGDRYQYTPCGITNACGAADGSSSYKWIWIVDTGIDLDHPDLNVQTSTTFAKSFVGGTAEDAHGHGTHVAGTAAAIDNSIGVVGVSAGARVVPVRVFNTGSSPTSTIIAGIDHVALYDIAGDVVNLSLGGGYSGTNCSTGTAYYNSIMNLANNGTFVAIAAGNSGTHANNTQPACMNGTNIYTITAMYCNKTWGGYNYGRAPIDYIATGRSVYSTYKNGGYATLSGTSMATPHVAGILHQRQASPRITGWVTDNFGTYYPIACR